MVLNRSQEKGHREDLEESQDSTSNPEKKTSKGEDNKGTKTCLKI